MVSETIRTEKLLISPTTMVERAAYLGARVTEGGAEITIKVEPTARASVKETRVLRFESSSEIAAMEDALRVMRMRLEEAEHAALTK